MLAGASQCCYRSTESAERDKGMSRNILISDIAVIQWLSVFKFPAIACLTSSPYIFSWKRVDRIILLRLSWDTTLKGPGENVYTRFHHIKAAVVIFTSHTLQSTQARQEALLDLRPELDLQHPLFSLHSFTDHKVTSDLRFKVSEALRKAGLHTTDYGRRVLANVPPSHPPRPDQHSSVFKQ